jgi:hypothetical protein
MLRVVARLAPGGWRQADSARCSAVRGRGGVPQRYRKGPAGEVPHNRIGERGDAECNERRDASSVPMTSGDAKVVDRGKHTDSYQETLEATGPRSEVVNRHISGTFRKRPR